ncbi:MAG: DUF2723 domain-containing protein, partial [Myxococcota bacterium]
SGELIAVAYSGRIPHPPGYPLYMMIARGVSSFPFGDVALRVNLLSALCDALAAGVLCLTVSRWARSLGAGILAGGLFAFAPLVWSYAVVAEVFALNNLLVCGLFYVLVRYAEQPSVRWASWASLLVGLGLSNHHTFVVYAAPLALYVAWRGRDFLFRPRALVMVLAAFLLGVLPYAYLPLAGAAPNPLTWGDHSDFSGIMHHVLRRDYGTFQLGAGEAVQWGAGIRLQLVAESLFRNTLYVGFPVALFGWWSASLGSRTDRAIAGVMGAGFAAYLLMMAFLFNLAVSNPLLRGVEARFWQMAAIPVFAWTGLGAQRLADSWAARAEGRRAGGWVLGVALLAVALQVGLHFRAVDQRGNFVVRDYAQLILAGLPPGAVLILNSDLAVNTVRYLQAVEGFRRDVETIPLTWMQMRWYTERMRGARPEIEFPGWVLGLPGEPEQANTGSTYTLKDFFAGNLGSHEIFVYPGFGRDYASVIRPEYRTVPIGLAKQVLTREAAAGLDAVERRARALERLQGFDAERAEGYGAESWEFYAAQSYRRARDRIGRMGTDPANRSDYPRHPR